MARVVKGNPMRPRVLQVGYGAFGPTHARAWTKLGHGGDLVIAEPSPASSARSNCTGARVVADYRDALADADLVDIVTSSDTHVAIALDALDAGCDVFIEKPMTTTRADAERIERRARETGRVVQVGYFFRQHPMVQALRQRMAEVGQVIWVDADFVSLKRPRRDAGVVLNDAIHFLDLVCWLMPRPPREVTAMLRYPLGRAFEDIALIALGWADGAVARVQASCVLPGAHADPVVTGGWSEKRVSVTGSDGQIAVDFMTHELVSRRPRTAPETERLAAVETDSVIAAELAEFVECTRNGRTPSAGPESGVAMAALCDAIAQSAREQRTVVLP